MDELARLRRLHEIMYGEVERLITLDPLAGTENAIALTHLAGLLETWEKEFFFVRAPVEK